MIRYAVAAAGLALAAPALAQDAACTPGHVVDVRDGVAVLCVGRQSESVVGRQASAHRLTPVAGPSRHPYFVHKKVARLRVDSHQGDRAEAALLWGSVRPHDRIELD
jgi:hypothetical protein